jgi:hypothetical protein
MAITLDGTNGITTETGTGDVSVGDDLIFTGTGNRITGDFSNATLANRVAFQTSTVNSNTGLGVISNGTGNSTGMRFFNGSDPTNSAALFVGSGATDAYIQSVITGTGTYLPMTFYTGGGERMRIDSSGNLLVGTTSQINSGLICSQGSLNSVNTLVCKNTVAQGSGQSFAFFANSAGNKAGSIDHTGTTTVAYTTSSDYRMKENIAPMTGALTAVLQLKPCTYTWKEDGKAGQGFIAHELQEVVPDCVSGEKDAVDADGNPQYQGVDTSFLVATLTAAIQELKAELDEAKARIAALEGSQT